MVSSLRTRRVYIPVGSIETSLFLTVLREETMPAGLSHTVSIVFVDIGAFYISQLRSTTRLIVMDLRLACWPDDKH